MNVENLVTMAPPYKKRKTIDDRLAKIERSIVLTKPEEKHIFWDINETVLNSSQSIEELFVIAQGDRAYDRDGNEIRVTRIEIDLYCASTGLDVYLVRPHDSSDTFDSTDFSGLAHVNRAVNIEKWKVYKHKTSETNSLLVNWTQRFGSGMIVRYNGTTSTPETPQCNLVLSNYSGATIAVTGWARVFYVDA